MSKYLKKNNNTASSPALKQARRNIYWQAGLALTTIILTIIIIFAMTSAWYTNIVQTSGLVFEAEAWGFDGEIVVNNEAIKAAPGDEGAIHLEMTNSSDSITSVGVSASKSGMDSNMKKRLYFYADTQMMRNGETMERVYLNSMSNYTYTLFGGGKLTLTEETHSDSPLKWQWVYDMLGYYVLGSWENGVFTEIEYLRPVEYDYDEATFEYVTAEDGTVTIDLKTVDGETTVEQFLQGLSETDGYEKDIDFSNPKGEGYYPVEVDGEGYGVYVYLCSYAEIEMATKHDTQLGQMAANDSEGTLPVYPVTLSVSAQKNDENVVSVATLTALNNAMELMSGSTVQLAEDITLTGDEKLLVPEGTQVIVDLNDKKITSQTGGYAIQAEPGSSIIFINGEIEGSNQGTGIFSAGAEVTLNDVKISQFVDGIYVGDNASGNTMDSKVRLVDCEVDALDCAVYVSGNGSASEQKTQLVVENSELRSDSVVIYGNGNTFGNGRWGTDIQIIDSILESNPDKVGAGIYHPQKDSTLTIYNSTVSGYTGVAIKGGSVSVKASTVTGYGDALEGDPAPSKSGFDDTGDGIYIETNYGYEIHLEIGGANVMSNDKTIFKSSEISSTNNNSLRVWEPNAANVVVKISSGQFKEEQPENYIAGGSVQRQDGDGYIVEVDETQQ